MQPRASGIREGLASFRLLPGYRYQQSKLDFELLPQHVARQRDAAVYGVPPTPYVTLTPTSKSSPFNLLFYLGFYRGFCGTPFSTPGLFSTTRPHPVKSRSNPASREGAPVSITISKFCTPNAEDRCISCRGRRISTKKKRVCPLWQELQKLGGVRVYEMWVTSSNALRARIDELSEVIRDLTKNLPKQ